MNPVSRTLALVMTAWSLAVGAAVAAQGVTTYPITAIGTHATLALWWARDQDMVGCRVAGAREGSGAGGSEVQRRWAAGTDGQ